MNQDEEHRWSIDDCRHAWARNFWSHRQEGINAIPQPKSDTLQPPKKDKLQPQIGSDKTYRTSPTFTWPSPIPLARFNLFGEVYMPQLGGGSTRNLLCRYRSCGVTTIADQLLRVIEGSCRFFLASLYLTDFRITTNHNESQPFWCSMRLHWLIWGRRTHRILTVIPTCGCLMSCLATLLSWSALKHGWVSSGERTNKDMQTADYSWLFDNCHIAVTNIYWDLQRS